MAITITNKKPFVPPPHPLHAPSTPPPCTPSVRPSAPLCTPSAPLHAPSAPLCAPLHPLRAPSAPLCAPLRPLHAPPHPLRTPSASLHAPSVPPLHPYLVSNWLRFFNVPTTANQITGIDQAHYHKILIFSPTTSLKCLRAARIDELADSNEPAKKIFTFYKV